MSAGDDNATIAFNDDTSRVQEIYSTVNENKLYVKYKDGSLVIFDFANRRDWDVKISRVVEGGSLNYICFFGKSIFDGSIRACGYEYGNNERKLIERKYEEKFKNTPVHDYDYHEFRGDNSLFKTGWTGLIPYPKVNYSNGDLFVGRWKGVENIEGLQWILNPGINSVPEKKDYLCGVFYPANNGEPQIYVYGNTWEEEAKVAQKFIDEEKMKEQREEQAKKEASERAYNNLCQKYGQKYVDAARAQKVIVGMPYELFIDYFTGQTIWHKKHRCVFYCKLVSESNYSYQYRVDYYGDWYLTRKLGFQYVFITKSNNKVASIDDYTDF